MYSIILCEGDTDAILISYYLKNIMDFDYTNKKNLPQLNTVNSKINWYKNTDDHFLAICPIGGSNFEYAISEINKYNNDADIDNAFFRIAAIMDNDDTSVEETVRNIGISLNCDEVLNSGHWRNFSYNNNFGDTILGRVVCILQPSDNHGALETFVLQMISQNNAEIASVVEQSRTFIQNFESDIFLRRRRERTKAELSVSLSVISPDRTFTTINEFLLNIEWERYYAFHRQFALLENFRRIEE